MNETMPAACAAMTLVIPTYNRADLVGECVVSALQQTLPFAQIIVVDDGSSDGTAQALSAYGERITGITTANAGVQAARNRGVAASHTALVALCDSDDLLQADFVATVAPWMAGRPDVDALYCNFSTFDHDGSHPDKLSLAPPDFFRGAREDGEFCSDIPQLTRRLLDYQPLFPTGCVVRKSFYERIGGYDTRFNRVGAEDFEFLLRAASAGHVAVCRKPLARIRKHPGNDSASNLRQLLGECLILEYSLANHAGAKSFSGEILASVQKRRLAAFDMAFAEGDFACAGQIAARLGQMPLSANYLFKRCLSLLPEPLRRSLWSMSQRQGRASRAKNIAVT